jgi:hypothetical protein
MTTTTLIVEILISGILTCLWLLLGTITAFGSGFLLGAAKDYPEAFAALAIAVAYTVGVTFDRLWDFFTTRVDEKIRRTYFPADDQLTTVRMQLFGTATALQGYMEYIRSRMRIARAAMCNLPLIGLTGLGAALRHSCWQPWQFFVFAGLAILMSVAAAYSFHKLEHAYYKQLQAVGNFLQRKGTG